MVRLLIMNHATMRSGGEISLLQTVRLLNKTRFDIVVALPDDRGMLPEELVKIPQVRLRVVQADSLLIGMRKFNAISTVLRQPQLIAAFLEVVRRHICLIQEERIDLILTNSIKSDYYGSLAAAMTNRPVVWSIRDIVDGHYFPWWARCSLAIFANLFAARIFCNSNATAQALVRIGVDERKLLTIYPPMLEQDEVVSGGSIRQEIGLSPTTRLVTMVGRITNPKGQLEFVKAASYVTTLKKDVAFLIIGDSIFGSKDDDYKKEVENAVQQLPEPQCVCMLGERHDVQKIMVESDVVVAHSLWPEGFGRVVAEAMELGRPVVSTPVGGLAEMIEDGITGLSVDPGDIISLSRAICKLLDDPKEAQALGLAGQRRIRHIASLENVRRLEAALEDTVQEHKKC